MKEIKLNIPTNFKEIKEKLRNIGKVFTHPIRMKHNAKVMSELEATICNELKSGYWSKDISEYMKEELTRNGKIRTFIVDAFNKLK